MSKFPCFKCAERDVGCHSTCQKYLEAKAKQNEAWLERRDAQRAEADFRDFKIVSIEKTMKKRR